MNQLNQIILEGNIVRKPEIKNTANGKKLALMTIASNRYVKKQDGEFIQEVYYFDCEAWGNFAETVEEKASKGTACRIVGRLKQDRWKGSDGKSYSKVAIVCEHIDLLQKNERNESQAKDSANFDKSNLFGSNAGEMSSEEDVPKAAGFDIF